MENVKQTPEQALELLNEFRNRAFLVGRQMQAQDDIHGRDFYSAETLTKFPVEELVAHAMETVQGESYRMMCIGQDKDMETVTQQLQIFMANMDYMESIIPADGPLQHLCTVHANLTVLLIDSKAQGHTLEQVAHNMASQVPENQSPAAVANTPACPTVQ